MIKNYLLTSKTSFSYEKLSENHFSHMNIDENTTPDRFEALPVLLDHLNDEFKWF